MPMAHGLPFLPSGVVLDVDAVVWVDVFDTGTGVWNTYQTTAGAIAALAAAGSLPDPTGQDGKLLRVDFSGDPEWALFSDYPQASGGLSGSEIVLLEIGGALIQSTVAAIVAAASGAQLGNVNVFTKNQSVASNDNAAATGAVTLDASLSNNFQLTITGNLTLNAPSNPTKGMVINIELTEDGTGGWTITLNAVFKFPGGTIPTWVTTAGAKNFISAYYDGAAWLCGGGAGYA